ncbi:MAG TPA: hypothetical protein DCP08_03700 [Chloroflexi bacterium]|nr:hypothetical protein [Chloroflexota bacterium]
MSTLFLSQFLGLFGFNGLPGGDRDCRMARRFHKERPAEHRAQRLVLLVNQGLAIRGDVLGKSQGQRPRTQSIAMG